MTGRNTANVHPDKNVAAPVPRTRKDTPQRSRKHRYPSSLPYKSPLYTMASDYPDPEESSLVSTSETTTRRGTKRSHQKSESITKADEDIAQIRKRVIEVNNALRASGLAWTSDAGGGIADDAEGPSDASSDSEESEEVESESDIEGASPPPSPIAADSTHVWVVSSEMGGDYIDTGSDVTGVFRHFNDALEAAKEDLGQYGYGEADDNMHFTSLKGLSKLAEKLGDGYRWRFEGEEQWMTVNIERMLIQ